MSHSAAPDLRARSVALQCVAINPVWERMTAYGYLRGIPYGDVAPPPAEYEVVCAEVTLTGDPAAFPTTCADISFVDDAGTRVEGICKHTSNPLRDL